MTCQKQNKFLGNKLPLKVIDLFAGVGGFSLGFVNALYRGLPVYDIKLLVDNDATAANTFKRNFPNLRYLVADLRVLAPEDIRSHAGLGQDDEIDVLIGGPPCQGLSTIGKRLIDDPRNELLLTYLEHVRKLKPKIVLLENVPVLLSASASTLADRLFNFFDECGYDHQPAIVNAANYGVPQFRQRAIIAAFRRDANLGDPFVVQGNENHIEAATRLIPRDHETYSMEGDIARLTDSFITVEEAIGDLPSLQPGEGSEVSRYTSPPLSKYQAERRKGARLLFNHKARNHSEAFIEKIKIISEGGRNQELDENLRFSDNYFSQAYARLHRKAIAQTISTHFFNPGSGRFTHYRDLRAITVREAARFQSFDDTFVFLGNMTDKQRHIGNAVPPLMGKVMAEGYASLLMETLKREDEVVALSNKCCNS